jgi:dihydroxyacetone kinase-like protein
LTRARGPHKLGPNLTPAVFGRGPLTSREAAFDGALVRSWIELSAESIADQRDFLTQLDAAIGDADHGVNMDRGFSEAVRELGSTDGSPGALLDRVGRVILFRVGGAAGPLFGGAFRAAGRALGDAERPDAQALLEALRAALGEIQRLGAAVEGDKTIVDAFAPALGAFERRLRAGAPLAEATGQAKDAAERGMRATIPMQARKGRASYLGARSVGHQDPGATSTFLLFDALDRTVRQGAAP